MLPDVPCRVQLGAGGMDALIRLGGGDMRRTLNILQVRCGQQQSPCVATVCHTLRGWHPGQPSRQLAGLHLNKYACSELMVLLIVGFLCCQEDS